MDKRAFDNKIDRILKQISVKPLQPNLFELENGPIHFIMRTSDERAVIRKVLEVWAIFCCFLWNVQFLPFAWIQWSFLKGTTASLNGVERDGANSKPRNDRIKCVFCNASNFYIQYYNKFYIEIILSQICTIYISYIEFNLIFNMFSKQNND